MRLFTLLLLFSVQSVAALPERLVSITPAIETKPVDKKLVYFWATWCTNCHEKLVKTLPDLRKDHKDVEITTVSLDSERERLEHYVKKQQLELPVLFDPIGKLSEEMDISAVPYWIVFKKDPKTLAWITVDSAVAFDLTKIEKALK